MVLNVRTGSVYGAATGFAVGLVWQAVAGYEDPLALWRTCLLIGTLTGGCVGLGFVLAKRKARPPAAEEPADDAG